jgi:hypothetical protein
MLKKESYFCSFVKIIYIFVLGIAASSLLHWKKNISELCFSNFVMLKPPQGAC